MLIYISVKKGAERFLIKLNAEDLGSELLFDVNDLAVV
jgi:hypothetical protein